MLYFKCCIELTKGLNFAKKKTSGGKAPIKCKTFIKIFRTQYFAECQILQPSKFCKIRRIPTSNDVNFAATFCTNFFKISL